MDNENGYKNYNYEKLKCIWMASQVIEYKLCDHQFDCENCLFDKVMRNLLHEKESDPNDKSNIASNISHKLQSVKYDNKIIYLKNNLIAKEICHNTFYLGINPILICFLDAVNRMMVSEFDRNIYSGQQIVHISGAWGAFSLSAPINFIIHDLVGDPADSPFKSQWFAIIGVNQQEISSGQLYQKEWNEMHSKAIQTIEEIKLQIPKVGETMLDGGSQIKYLHQIVGSKKYINLLDSLGG